jgi:hypothetical protein
MVANKKSDGSQHLESEEKNAQLRYIQEIIQNSHQGVTVDDQAPLEKKTNNEEILARLLEIEKAIIKRARQKGFR